MWLKSSCVLIVQMFIMIKSEDVIPLEFNLLTERCENRTIVTEIGKKIKVLATSITTVDQAVCRLAEGNHEVVAWSSFMRFLNSTLLDATVEATSSMNGEWWCIFGQSNKRQKQCFANVKVVQGAKETIPVLWICIGAGAAVFIIVILFIQCVIIMAIIRKRKGQPVINLKRLSAYRESRNKRESENVYEDINRRPPMPIPKEEIELTLLAPSTLQRLIRETPDSREVQVLPRKPSPVSVPPKPSQLRPEVLEENGPVGAVRPSFDSVSRHHISPTPPVVPPKRLKTPFLTDHLQPSKKDLSDTTEFSSTKTNPQPKFLQNKFNERLVCKHSRNNLRNPENDICSSNFVQTLPFIKRSQEHICNQRKLQTATPNLRREIEQNWKGSNDSSAQRQQMNIMPPFKQMQSSLNRSELLSQNQRFNQNEATGSNNGENSLSPNNTLGRRPITNNDFFRKLAVIAAQTPGMVNAKNEIFRPTVSKRDSTHIYEEISDEEYWEA